MDDAIKAGCNYCKKKLGGSSQNGTRLLHDPRYKLKFVDLLFPVLYGQDRSAVELEKLKVLVYTLFQEYECSDPRC